MFEIKIPELVIRISSAMIADAGELAVFEERILHACRDQFRKNVREIRASGE